MFIEKNICFFHGNFASQPGTSGGPVMMGGKVVAVNCGAGGGSRTGLASAAFVLPSVRPRTWQPSTGSPKRRFQLGKINQKNTDPIHLRSYHAIAPRVS